MDVDPPHVGPTGTVVARRPHRELHDVVAIDVAERGKGRAELLAVLVAEIDGHHPHRRKLEGEEATHGVRPVDRRRSADEEQGPREGAPVAAFEHGLAEGRARRQHRRLEPLSLADPHRGVPRRPGRRLRAQRHDPARLGRARPEHRSVDDACPSPTTATPESVPCPADSSRTGAPGTSSVSGRRACPRVPSCTENAAGRTTSGAAGEEPADTPRSSWVVVVALTRRTSNDPTPLPRRSPPNATSPTVAPAVPTNSCSTARRGGARSPAGEGTCHPRAAARVPRAPPEQRSPERRPRGP